MGEAFKAFEMVREGSLPVGQVEVFDGGPRLRGRAHAQQRRRGARGLIVVRRRGRTVVVHKQNPRRGGRQG